MKKTNQINPNKLQFRKQAIANLTKSEMSNVQGGQAAWTTSHNQCSGFLCCAPNVPVLTDMTGTVTLDGPDKPANGLDPQP